MVKKLAITFCLVLGFVSAETGTLVVQGEATRAFPAERLSLSCSVVNQASDADSALTENNEKVSRVLMRLIDLGLNSDHFSTEQFNLRPIQENRPRDPKPDWTPSIVGYQVSHTISIGSDHIDQAGKIIDAVTKAGVNQISSINFELKDPEQKRRLVIEEATEQALENAVVLAKAAGQSLGKVLSVSLDGASFPRPQKGMLMAHRATPITPGDFSLSSKVTVVYELE